MTKILRFYLPLALPAVLVGISHGIVSWVLTRMENASVVLSAYALASGVAMLSEAPVIAVRQVAMTLVRSQRSWRIIRLISWVMGLSSLVLELLVAFTPLSGPVLRGIFRVPDPLVAPTLAVFQLYLLLVVISTWRFMHQGVTIGQKRPLYMTAGMVIRLPFQILLAYGTVQWGWIPPLWAGPGVLLSAILIEGIVAWVGSSRILRTLPEDEPPPQEDQPAALAEQLTARSVLRFFLPLAASFFLYALGRPAINAAVGSTPHAEPALATLTIVYILFFIFLGPLQVLHQVVVVFPGEQKRTLRFAFGAGLIASLLLLLLGSTELGVALLVSAFEVPAALQGPLAASVRVMAAWPLIFALGDYLQGMLLVDRNTRPVGIAKFAGVIVSVGLVKLLIGLAGSPAAAASIAVAGMAGGAAAETGVMYGLRRLART